jgi:integrase
MSSETDPVQNWLDSCSSLNTQGGYRSYFRLFEEHMQKTGREMLQEFRVQVSNPETCDYYPSRLFGFYKLLLSGEVKAKRMGSRKGHKGGWTGRYKDKPLSQQTARTAVNSVMSFFAFHNLPINLKKFIKKDVRMKKPKPEKKKHQLLASELEALFRVASLRDKAVLALGLMGQDESTVSSLHIEQFAGKLNGETLEFVELLRPKTNEDILLVLTPEVQAILKTYILSLKLFEGWLFPGYKNKPINPQLCNDIFQQLCDVSGIRDNEKRLSFHCCRMWFSAQLRNKVSDDLIDLCTGHDVRFGGAYLGDLQKTRETMISVNVIDLLRLQSALKNGLSKTVQEELRKKDEEIKALEERMDVVTNTFDNVSREFLTMLLVVGEKGGNEALLKMVEETKQRLRTMQDSPKLSQKG